VRSPILAVLLGLLVGVSPAQKRDGIYKPAGGNPTPWIINEHQTLIWNGQPYIPIGVKIDGTSQAVDAAKAAGITDVIVDLPANGVGWDPVIEALNKAKMHFLIRVDSLAPMAKGFAIEPQGYRVAGIKASREVKLEIPGATSAFVVLATKGDGSIVANGRVPIINGQLTYFAKIGPEIEHVLLVYPEMTSIEQPDFWEDLDTERDELLGSLRKHNPGEGFRGIVNPMGRGLTTTVRDPHFVPTSAYFRMEFRSFLEQKYKNVETVIKSWSMTSSTLTQIDDKTKKWLVSFDALAKLIPLWTTTRGIGAMLDPDTNIIYSCDGKLSQAWSDISQVINAAGERRFSRIVPAIRAITDVPVIQDWLGWAAPYETRQPVIDGVGMRASGTTQSVLAESGSRAASSILRWSTHGWLVTTDLDMGAGADAPAQLGGVIDDLTSMGARGIFVRSESPALLKKIAAESRLRATDTSLMGKSPLPVFFPENASNPAVPQKLPGDHWWLPTPSDGNRIDLGSLFYAYRSGLNEGTFALWTKVPGRYRLHMSNARSVRFRTLDGSDPLPKVSKDTVELSITEFPLIITGTMEVPVPDIALAETVQQFRVMLASAQRNHGESDEIEMLFSQAMTGFDRNPGGSFEQMRKQYWKLAEKVAPYTWIECERYSESNFSEVVKNPGCSAGLALSLRTLIPPGPGGYYAEYSVQVRSKEDQEVWVSAKIPSERRGDVSVFVGGQQMLLTGEPTSIYAGGFGWYKLGTTRLAGNMTKLRLQVETAGNAEIAFDTILLSPSPFKPNGVTRPEPSNFHGVQSKPMKNPRRRGSGGS